VKSLLRKVHRWLGLLMALQIVAWMASGLWFAIYPIETIRGEHLTRPSEELQAGSHANFPHELSAPAALHKALDEHFAGDWALSSVQLHQRNGEIAWRVSGTSRGQAFVRLLDGDGSRVRPGLTVAAAERQALDWLVNPGEVRSVEWIEQVEADAEIRGRAPPFWKVSFNEPESLNLYLDPWTGEILARRTTRWRVFDFLWMLHIMDFETRDDFNHPLLQVAAALGLIIALSGVALWAVTTTSFGRRRRSLAAPEDPG
jgi:uncharacterized iron-regulated membrane protein